MPKDKLNALLKPCDNRDWGGYYSLMIYSTLTVCLLWIIVYKLCLGIIARIINNETLLKKAKITYQQSQTVLNPPPDYYNEYSKGLKCLDNKQYTEAVKYFSIIIDEGWDFAPVPIDDIYVYRGIAYSNLGMNAEAKTDFCTAISMYSYDNSTAHLERGKIYLREKNYELAIEDFNKAIKMNYSENGDDFFFRGLAYIQLGEKQKAIKDLTKALQLAGIYDKETQDKCSFILNKLKVKTAKTPKKTGTHKVIKVKTCTEKAILTLEGFNEEKAKRFIQERANGKMWYDLDSFVTDFNIQPHEMVMIQDRLIFPPKPKVKMGKRKLDI